MYWLSSSVQQSIWIYNSECKIVFRKEKNGESKEPHLPVSFASFSTILRPLAKASRSTVWFPLSPTNSLIFSGVKLMRKWVRHPSRSSSTDKTPSRRVSNRVKSHQDPIHPCSKWSCDECKAWLTCTDPSAWRWILSNTFPPSFWPSENHHTTRRYWSCHGLRPVFVVRFWGVVSTAINKLPGIPWVRILAYPSARHTLVYASSMWKQGCGCSCTTIRQYDL